MSIERTAVPGVTHEVIIIGSGLAGNRSAVYATRAGLAPGSGCAAAIDAQNYLGDLVHEAASPTHIVDALEAL